MCVIAIYEDNYPKLKDLQDMENLNNDGAGFSYIKNNKLYFEKSMNLTAKMIIDKIKINKIKLPIIIHFRIKSSGILSDSLCHPFIISKNSKTLNKLKGNNVKSILYHNGTYREWQEDLKQICILNKIKIPNGDLSDSKALSFICSIMGDNYLNVIDTESRFIIQTKDKILKFGKWSEIDKVSLSNENHIKKDYSFNNDWNFEKSKTKKIDELPNYKDLNKTNFQSVKDMTNKEKEDLNHDKIKQYNKVNESIENLENNLELYHKNIKQLREDKKKNLIDKTQKRIMDKMGLKLTLEQEIEDLYQNSDIITDDYSIYNYGY